MVIGMGVGVACLGGVAEVRSLAESGGSAKAVATAIRPTNSSKARPSLPQRSNERPPQSPAPAARSAPRTSHPAVDSNPQNEVPAPASSPVGDLPAAAQSAQASRLARELVMLQSARSLLAAGAALQASQRLADYSREFPGGALRAEALALDVESAALLGNRARVADLEAAFIRDFPTSPLVGRVRALASAQR
jgi:hypothetical protein